ncbi:hypothetical protein D3C72_2225570 [compost metagenome]
MEGRTFTSVARNRLSVGVCNAPAIPVRNATTKKASEVRSGERRVTAVEVGIEVSK